MLLLSFLSVVNAAHQASVYRFPMSHEHSPPTLSAPESRQIFSQIFKVTRYHKLGFIGQSARVLDQMNEFGLWQEASGSVVLNIAGVTDSKHIYPDAKPLYHIADSPASDAYSDLLLRLLGQSEDLRGERLEKVYGNAKGGGLYLSPPLRHIHEHVRHGPSIARFEEFYGSDVAKHFDITITEDRGFIAELSALESFIDALSRAPRPLTGQYAAGHLVGLEILFYKYGAHSPQYAAGVKAVHISMSTLYDRIAEQSSNLVVSLLPPVQRHTSILRRWEENEAAFGDIHAAPALEGFSRLAQSDSTKPGLGGCYNTQDACESDTNKCSGHGACHKYLDQESCYQCVCVPTVIEQKEGKKTIDWAGPRCAKKDVSFEFQVFFWFTILMVSTIWWSVKMLNSVEIGSGILSATGYIK